MQSVSKKLPISFAIGLMLSCALLSAQTARAQAWEGPPQGLKGSDMGGLGKPINYVEIKGVEGIAPLGHDNAGIRANIVVIDQKPDVFQIGLNAHVLRFDQPEAIGNTNNNLNQATAQNLWSTELSFSYSHTLEDQNEWGVIASVGSDSDQPFDAFRDVTFSVTGTYKKKVDALHSWIFFLNYSPNRAFLPNVPIPGAGYLSINPPNHTVMFLGVPFFFAWQATPDVQFKFSYFIPTIISTEWNYRIVDQVKAYVGFDWVPESWYRADRPDGDSDRIIFDRKKALVGIKAPIFNHWFINAYGGYYFDGKLFEAKDLTSSNIAKTYVENQAAIGADIAFQF